MKRKLLAALLVAVTVSMAACGQETKEPAADGNAQVLRRLLRGIQYGTNP